MPNDKKRKLPYTKQQYLNIVRDQLPAVYKILPDEQLEKVAANVDPNYPNYEFAPKPIDLSDDVPDTEPGFWDIAWQTARSFYYRFPEQLAANAISFEILAQKLRTNRLGEQLPEQVKQEGDKAIKSLVDVYVASRNHAAQTLAKDPRFRAYAEWAKDASYSNAYDLTEFAKVAWRDFLSGFYSFGQTMAAGLVGQVVAGPAGAALGAYTTGFLMENSDAFSQYYDRAKEQGMSDEEASRFVAEAAVMYGAVSGAMESLVPLTLTKSIGLLGNARKNVFSRFATKFFANRAFKNTGPAKAAARAITEVAEENIGLFRRIVTGLATMGIEQGTEGATEITQYAMQRAIEDNLFGEDVTPEKIAQYLKEQEAISSFVGGFLGAGPFTSVQAYQEAAGSQGQALAQELHKEYKDLPEEARDKLAGNVIQSKELSDIDKVAFARKWLELEGKSYETKQQPQPTTPTEGPQTPSAATSPQEAPSTPTKPTKPSEPGYVARWLLNPTSENEPKGLKGSRPSTKLVNFFLSADKKQVRKELKALSKDERNALYGKLLLALKQALPSEIDGKPVNLDLNSFRADDGSIDPKKVFNLLNKLRSSKIEVGSIPGEESDATGIGKEELIQKDKKAPVSHADLLDALGIVPKDVLGPVIDITGDMFESGVSSPIEKPSVAAKKKKQAKTQTPSDLKRNIVKTWQQKAIKLKKENPSEYKQLRQSLISELKATDDTAEISKIGNKYLAQISSPKKQQEPTVDQQVQEATVEESVQEAPKQKYVLHSGGAKGSDTYWGEVGQKYGVEPRHYYHKQKTPAGNIEISEEDAQEGAVEAARAAYRNFGYKLPRMKDARLIRNWSQVKYADAIFAVGKLVPKGGKLFPGKSGDKRIAQAPSVAGGTGYAVAMGIIHGKPVYVFNQTKSDQYDVGWYRYDEKVDDFVKIDAPPKLTPNFAGIGTRQLNEAGKKAIEEVYRTTFEGKEQQETKPTFKASSELAKLKTKYLNRGADTLRAIAKYDKAKANRLKPKLSRAIAEATTKERLDEIMSNLNKHLKKAQGQSKQQKATAKTIKQEARKAPSVQPKQQPTQKPKQSDAGSNTSTIDASSFDKDLFAYEPQMLVNKNIKSFIAGIAQELPYYDAEKVIPYFIPANPSKEFKSAYDSVLRDENKILAIRLDYLGDTAAGDSMRVQTLIDGRSDGTIVYIDRDSSDGGQFIKISGGINKYEHIRVYQSGIEEQYLQKPNNPIDATLLSAKMYNAGREQRELLFDFLRNNYLPEWSLRYIDPGANNNTYRVLVELANNAFLPQHRKIARALLRVAEKNPVEIDWDYTGVTLFIRDNSAYYPLGMYSVLSNKIYINFSAVSETQNAKDIFEKYGGSLSVAQRASFENTILHEIVHAYTTFVMHNVLRRISGADSTEVNMAVNKLSDIYSKVKNSLGFDYYYALEDRYEFAAELLSSVFAYSGNEGLIRGINKILSKEGMSSRELADSVINLIEEASKYLSDFSDPGTRSRAIRVLAGSQFFSLPTNLYESQDQINSDDNETHNYEADMRIYRSHIVEKYDVDPGSLLRSMFIKQLGVYMTREQYAELASFLAAFRDSNIMANNDTFNDFVQQFMNKAKEVIGTEISYDANDPKFRRAVKMWYQRVTSRIPVSYGALRMGMRNNLQVVVDQSDGSAKLQILDQVNLATGRNNPAMEVENFIEEDAKRFGVNNTWLYLSYKNIFIKKTTRDELGNVIEYYTQMKPGESPINHKWIVRLLKDMLNQGTPIVFIADVSGDDSKIIFAPAKTVYMGKTREDLIDYLDKEIDAGNIAPVHKELFLEAYDAFERVGYSEPAMYVMSYHDRLKTVKGDNYLMEEVDENGNLKESSSISKTWKRIKGDLAKGTVLRGVGDRRIMYIDANEAYYEIPSPTTGKYERVDAMLPGGRTVADGTMWTSKLFMDDMNRVSGFNSYVYKTYVRHRSFDNPHDYTMIKMLEVTPYDGMRVVKKDGTLVAKYEKGIWRDAQGNEIDSIATINDEVKQARGIFTETFKIHRLPEYATKVLQIHEDAHPGSAHPNAAHTISLSREFYRNAKMYQYLQSIFEHYAVKAHQYNEALYETLKDPKKLRQFVLREIDPYELPDEFQLAVRIDESGKLLWHSHFSRLLFRIINRRLLSDGLLKARPFNKQFGTLLHIKAGIGLGLNRGEFMTSANNKVLINIALKAYEDKTGSKLDYKKLGAKRTIEELNKFLFENNVRLLVHRQPVNNFANMKTWRFKGFVPGAHGPVAFMHHLDVFEVLEGDFDGDEVHVEYIPTETVQTVLPVPGVIRQGQKTNLIEALHKIENSPAFLRRRYQPLLDVFKPYLPTKSLADIRGAIKSLTKRKQLFALQGTVVNARSLLHTLSWKNFSLVLEDSDGVQYKIKAYSPEDRVVIKYFELDPNKLNEKHESGKTYRQLLEEQGAKVIEVGQPAKVSGIPEDKIITGDIWELDGYKVVSTNLGGVHGRGLAKQAKDKGLISSKNINFETSPLSRGVITIAVKGWEPSTQKVPGREFSERVTGRNIDLLSSEIDKLIEFARNNRDKKIYLPFIGLGFGEGNPQEILPILARAAQEPNIYLVSKSSDVAKKYASSFAPGVRSDKTVSVASGKKYYLETTKEHEFVILLQAAVDNEKYGLFDSIDFRGMNLAQWLATRIFYVDVNGRKMPLEPRFMKYVSAIRAIINYSAVRQGIDRSNRRKVDFYGNLTASEIVHSMFYNDKNEWDPSRHDEIMFERLLDVLSNRNKKARNALFARRNTLRPVAVETNKNITPDEYIIASIYGYYIHNMQQTTIDEELHSEHPVLYPAEFYRVAHSYATAVLADSKWVDEFRAANNKKELYQAYVDGIRAGKEYYQLVGAIADSRAADMSPARRMMYLLDAFQQVYSADYDEQISDFVAKYYDKYQSLPEDQKRWWTIGMLSGATHPTTLPPLRLMHHEILKQYGEAVYEYLYGEGVDKEVLIYNVQDRAAFNKELLFAEFQKITGGERCG